jgi:hypothetical protein
VRPTAIIANSCRGCAATGFEHVSEDGEFFTCVRCGGTGDQLGFMLMEACRLGRRDGIEWTKYAAKMAEDAEPLTFARLREFVG